MDPRKTFALDVRIIVCKNCGAPLPAPPLGGQVGCEYCDAVNQVAPRPELRALSAPKPAPVSDAAAEQQRVATLHYQARSYDPSNNPYAFLRAPAGLGQIERAVASKGFRDGGVAQQVQGGFAAAVAECEAAPGDPAAQRRCFWLARVLAQCWSSQDQFLRQRAVLETALEVLRDPGHKDIIECSLSSAARAMGDLASADAWLAQCDPRSRLLDIDSAYRVTAATLALTRGQWGQALALVGPGEGQVPFEPATRLLSRVIRAAGLEGAGNAKGAEQELRAAAAQHGRGDVKSLLEVNDAVAKARETFDRLGAQGALPRGPAKVRGLKLKGCLAAALTLALVGGVIAFYPIVCTGCGSLLGWQPAAMSRLRACPRAMEALGEPVRASYVGFSCGNFEVADGAGDASWRLPVTGSRASGVYEFYATTSGGGQWIVQRGSVTVEGNTIDLGNCNQQVAPMGLPPGASFDPGALQGSPGIPAALPAGACGQMAACCQVAGADPHAQALCQALPQLQSMGSVAEPACQSTLTQLRQRLQTAQGALPPGCQ